MQGNLVNCRIGSLEKQTATFIFMDMVNCRIGSLEKQSQA